MNRFQIKEMRGNLEYTYFVHEVTDDYILVSHIDDEDDKCYRAYYQKCPECGAFLLFDLEDDNCLCSNKDCEFRKAITLV